MGTNEELEREDVTVERRDHLKKKMDSIVTAAKVCSVIREHRECSIKLEGLSPVLGDTRSPKKLLDTKRGRINSFDDAKELDRINEKIPQKKPKKNQKKKKKKKKKK